MRARAGDTLTVRVPPTRSDVLHACDVAEDVAVAHGFNNVAETLPRSATIGRELPLNQLTELLRGDVAAAGFTEVLTWALCSKAENFASMRRADNGAVEIGNPATQEFQVRLGNFLLLLLLLCSGVLSLLCNGGVTLDCESCAGWSRPRVCMLSHRSGQQSRKM